MGMMNNKRGIAGLLVWALIFLLIAFVSGLFGFAGITGTSIVIAKWLAIIFVILFVISVIAHVIKNA